MSLSLQFLVVGIIDGLIVATLWQFGSRWWFVALAITTAWQIAGMVTDEIVTQLKHREADGK